MRVTTAILEGRLEWLLEANDPVSYAVGADWAVVHPLCAQIPRDLEALEMAWDSERVLVQSSMLSFVTPLEFSADVAEAFFGLLLRRLKFITRQPSVPTEIRGVGVEDYSELTLRAPTPNPASGRLQFVHNTETTAADFPKVAEALRDRDEAIPVYVMLALDALGAKREDPQKTILYCAFAIEVLAATMADNAYSEAKADSTDQSRWHLLDTKIAGGQVVTKDPVFELLRKTSRRGARYRLHELPLYALGRSLLAEDPTLFRDALRIHSTRNDIAHEGDGGDLLPVDYGGARDAVEVTRRVFAWFGVDDYFVSMDGPTGTK